MTRMSLSQRFWTMVRMNDGCWEWLGQRNEKGYGILKHGPHRTRKTQKAHRVAWGLMLGSIPSGLFVCHHCDNPACVNPSHLFLGTAQDNARDCVEKGRSIGTRGRRLTEVEVARAREMARDGATVASLADVFKVGTEAISRAVRGVSWKDVPGSLPDFKRRTGNG